jgi:glycosyltransferase involved in cell wall biosynthesis
VKIALVTTPPNLRSGIGDYTRRLLPYLREHGDIDIYVERDHESPEWGEERASSVHDLDPRRYDQVLFQLGNERHHGFMARMVRAIGGTVVQHDWVLFDLALAAFPGLLRGGAKGHLLALREGGVPQLRSYLGNWRDRRAQRTSPLHPEGVETLEGTILAGWHACGEGGRWTADRASLRIPSDEVREVEIDGRSDDGLRTRVLQGKETLINELDRVRRFNLCDRHRPLLLLDTPGLQPNPERRAAGDSRRLACLVRGVRWRDGSGWHDLDLSAVAARPVLPISLARDRFSLPLNRSIVRFADAFIVHSQYVRERILEDRNAPTPIGVLPHGAERLWSEEDRRERRRALGLTPEWVDSFLITSFGGVQRHKRIDKALEALALARRTHDDIRMVLAGSLNAKDCDPQGIVRRLGLGDAVRFAGFVSEEDGWSWLHAGDLALNLRGPSTGGTSGGILQAFSLSRAVIVSDAAEQRELPDACAIKIPIDTTEVETLARALIELRNDPARREQLETSVRGFVEEECHWKVVAARYAEFLDAFPPPRMTRRKLVALKVGIQRHERISTGRG